MNPTMAGPKKRASRGNLSATIADPAMTSTLAEKVKREVALETIEPKPRSSRGGPLSQTLADPALTSSLAAKVRRDVALESAEKDAKGDDGNGGEAEEHVVVVLGPDGMPQIAEEAAGAPETERVNADAVERALGEKQGR
jgi:hypothetical protein